MDITDKEFQMIQKLVYGLLGINLHESKKALIISRLSSRIKELGLDNFLSYLEYLKADAAGNEISLFINRVTTNETYFFRENNHFEYLRNNFLPSFVKRSGSLRVWSSACSSGEEPYSIAMSILEAQKNLSKFDVKILASDISTRVLDRAEKGIYNRSAVEEKIPKEYLKYFDVLSDEDLQVKKEVRQMVKFKQINLMADNYPIKAELDIIFCRNVMIYFDGQSRHHVIANFHRYLNSEGRLLVGHSENLFSEASLFKLEQNTVYSKVAA